MSWKHYLLAILAVGLLSAAFHGLGLIKGAPWQIVYSDTLGFYEKLSQPGLPYIDKLIEYPVITGFFMQVMAWLGQTRAGYFIFNSLFLILFAGLATFFLYKITPEQNKKNLWLFWILAPSMLIFSVYNWDLIAILFVIAAFYFIQKNKNGWAAFFLALGFCAKLYPIIYLPILLLKYKGGWLKIVAVFLITVLALNLYFMVSNFEGWSYFYTLNQTRNSNPDSIWTIARFFFRGLDVPAINTLSFLLLGSSYLILMWKLRRQNIILLCFIATLLFLLFNKVFTPQYLLWLLPFFALLPPPDKKWFYALEFSNLAALFLVLSYFFVKNNINYIYLCMVFVAIRHLVLIYLLWLSAKTNKFVGNRLKTRFIL